MQAPARCTPPAAACSVPRGRSVKAGNGGGGSSSTGERMRTSGRREETRRGVGVSSSMRRNGGFGRLEGGCNASYREYASPSKSATSVSDVSTCGDRTVPPSIDSNSASSRSSASPDLFILRAGAVPPPRHAPDEADSPTNGIDLRVAKAVSRSTLGSNRDGQSSQNGDASSGSPATGAAKRRLQLHHESVGSGHGRAIAAGARPSVRQSARQSRRETCDWCGACPANVIVSEATDAASEQPLRFCSEPCVNRYKMNIFCSETIEQLRKIEESGTGMLTPTATATAAVAAGGASSRIVITPELWSQRPKQQPQQLQRRRPSCAPLSPPPPPLPPPSLPVVPSTLRRRLALFERHLAIDIAGRSVAGERTLDSRVAAVTAMASTAVGATHRPTGHSDETPATASAVEAATTAVLLPPLSRTFAEPPFTMSRLAGESPCSAEAAQSTTAMCAGDAVPLAESRSEYSSSTRAAAAAAKRKLPHENAAPAKRRANNGSPRSSGETCVTVQATCSANPQQQPEPSMAIPSAAEASATYGQLIAAAAAAASAAVAATSFPAVAVTAPADAQTGTCSHLGAQQELRRADDASRLTLPPPPPQLLLSQPPVLKCVANADELAKTAPAATHCCPPPIKNASAEPVAAAIGVHSAAASCAPFGIPFPALLAFIPCPMMIPMPIPIPIPVPLSIYDKISTPTPR